MPPATPASRWDAEIVASLTQPPIPGGSPAKPPPSRIARGIGGHAVVLITVLAFAAGLVAGTLVAPLSSGALGQVQRERDDALAQLTQANLWLTDWEEWRKKAGDERNDRLKQIVSKGRGHDWMALPVEEKATIGSGMVFAFREFFGSDATPWFYCDLLDRAFAGSTTFRNEPIREVLALAAGLAAGARENAKASSPQPPAPPATPGKAPRRY